MSAEKELIWILLSGAVVYAASNILYGLYLWWKSTRRKQP